MPSAKDLTDTIARVSARDLFLILRTFDQSSESTLENIRLRLCHDRKKKRRGTFLWSTARDISSELDRLGYLSDVPSPKTSLHFEELSRQPIRLTDQGSDLLATFRESKANAYDQLFTRMYECHAYLRAFVAVIRDHMLLAPIVTSMKEHVSDRYVSTSALAEDVANGQFDAASLLSNLERRTRHPLSERSAQQMRTGVTELVQDAQVSAVREENARFAKNFIGKLNDIVIPTLFSSDGIGFDYRTHRTLWTLGQEFRVWCVTRSHPDYDGWLVYPTVRIELMPDGDQVDRIVFDSGLDATRHSFLERLHAAYRLLQARRKSTFVSAWELRATFCVEHRCQTSVFNQVFAENYTGSSEYQLHLEIQRNKPQHELPVRGGDRNIGAIRVAKQRA